MLNTISYLSHDRLPKEKSWKIDLQYIQKILWDEKFHHTESFLFYNFSAYTNFDDRFQKTTRMIYSYNPEINLLFQIDLYSPFSKKKVFLKYNEL